MGHSESGVTSYAVAAQPRAQRLLTWPTILSALFFLFIIYLKFPQGKCPGDQMPGSIS